DPLVSAVLVNTSDMDEEVLAGDLSRRLPLSIDRHITAPVDYIIGIGSGVQGADLMIDAAGWVAAIGEPVYADDDGNPVGPLAGAALGCAEVFKWAFTTTYRERAAQLEMRPWRGHFSCFSYELGEASPLLPEVVRIATTLVGLGGVGAGVIRTIAALGARVFGGTNLIDCDILTTDNLNRVSYATLAGALAGA